MACLAKSQHLDRQPWCQQSRGQNREYRLVLLRKGHSNAKWNLTLAAGQTWQRPIRVTVGDQGQPVSLAGFESTLSLRRYGVIMYCGPGVFPVRIRKVNGWAETDLGRVDNIALRKRDVYGTILVDIESRRPTCCDAQHSVYIWICEGTWRASVDAARPREPGLACPDPHRACPCRATITEISCTLRLERKTGPLLRHGKLIGGARLARPGLLGPHQDWLRQR